MKQKRQLETLSAEVDRDLYQAAKARLREIAVTPEYAVGQFLITCVNRKSDILRRFHQGEKAESVIEDIADETLLALAQTTARQRQMLQNMELEEREISITQLRRNWSRELSFLEEPGHVLIITRRGKRSAAMLSVETDLAMTSISGDDKTIRERCELMELLR